MIDKHCTYIYKVFMVESQADMMLWNITYIRGKHAYIEGITVFKFSFEEVHVYGQKFSVTATYKLAT